MSVEIIYETHSMTTDNEAGIATGGLPGSCLSKRDSRQKTHTQVCFISINGTHRPHRA